MIHVAGKVDPVEDIDVINFELALADITQIEKRLERIAKGRAKTKEEIASNEVQPSLLAAASETHASRAQFKLLTYTSHGSQLHTMTQHVCRIILRNGQRKGISTWAWTHLQGVHAA